MESTIPAQLQNIGKLKEIYLALDLWHNLGHKQKHQFFKISDQLALV